MKFFNSWIFKPLPLKEKIGEEGIKKKNAGSEEAPKNDSTSEVTIKEKMIVVFIWMLIVFCVCAFLLWVVLSIMKDSFASEMCRTFSYCLSLLIGYFFGANKQRE